MTAQPQRAPPSEERPLWKLNRDEQRMMMITVVGGLVSILLGAVIIGVAIAFTRLSYHNKVLHAGLHTGAWLPVTLPLAAVLAILLAIARTAHPTRKVSTRNFRRVAQGIIGLVVLVGVIQVLVWIGDAAGIK
jgi:hypothetical protein